MPLSLERLITYHRRISEILNGPNISFNQVRNILRSIRDYTENDNFTFLLNQLTNDDFLKEDLESAQQILEVIMGDYTRRNIPRGRFAPAA